MVQLPPLNLALPAIKQAVYQGLLQAQTQKGSVAQYQGPCAIGVVLPPETQTLLDYGSSEGAYGIRSFFDTREVAVADGDETEDWESLQRNHDRWFTYGAGGDFERSAIAHEDFIALIDKLMLKYPLFPSQQ